MAHVLKYPKCLFSLPNLCNSAHGDNLIGKKYFFCVVRHIPPVDQDQKDFWNLDTQENTFIMLLMLAVSSVFFNVNQYWVSQVVGNWISKLNRYFSVSFSFNIFLFELGFQLKMKNFIEASQFAEIFVVSVIGESEDFSLVLSASNK